LVHLRLPFANRMKTILILEDDPGLMMLFRQVLKHHDLLEATTAGRAIQLFRDNQSRIGVLIADVRLPAGSGIQVALHFRALTADLPVILTSGYPVANWSRGDTADLIQLGPDSVTILEKPFPALTLVKMVDDVIRFPQMQRAGGS
jgi:two-component system, cell cycle response regulator CpdR